MKTTITLLIVILISISSLAQVDGLNYKAIVKDASGNVLANQALTLQFTISEISDIPMIVYRENHTGLMTNSNGLIITNIGEGTPLAGFFPDIEWDKGVFDLNVQVDIGPGFVDMGTTLFKFVPLAFHAQTVSEKAFKSEGGLIAAEIITDDFVVGSKQLNDDTSTSTDNSKMFFDKAKSAFRAGYTAGDQWNSIKIGAASFASGENTIASGLSSTAMGYETTALGTDATAMGSGTNANGISSTSMGRLTNATPYASVSMGRFNESIGNPTSWVAGDPLLMIGNGTSTANKNNALTIYKNGNAEFDGEIRHTSTGAANMIPIAYGSISATGSILGGTGNFTVLRINAGTSGVSYVIAVNGKTLSDTNSIASITPHSIQFRTTATDYNSGTLDVFIYPFGTNRVSEAFQFVIYQQ